MNAAEAAAELMGTAAPTGQSDAMVALGNRASDPTTLDLSKLSEKLSLAKISRPNDEELSALASRIVAGREKIAAAKAANADPQKVKKAELTLAELDDKLTAEIGKEAQWYALDVAYLIGREFLRKLHRAAEGGTLTLHLPAAGQSFTLALDGEDDEPPF